MHGDPNQPGQGLSVGGPSGIHIQGSDVSAGGPPPPAAGTPPAAATNPAEALQAARQQAEQLAAVGAGAQQVATGVWGFVRRKPKPVAIGLGLAGLAVMIGPLGLLSSLGAPMGFLLIPAIPGLALLGGAAALLIWEKRRGADLYVDPEMEQRLLQLAARHDGRLTVAGTAAELGLPLATVENALMALALSGHVELENPPGSAQTNFLFRDLAREPGGPRQLSPQTTSPGPGHDPSEGRS